MELIKLLTVIENLLLEKVFVIGPSLLKRLESIEHKIAYFILDCVKDELDLDNTDYSFVDSTYDNDKVSFLKNRWDESNPYGSSRRETMKIGKLITALSEKKGITFTSSEIEHFIKLYIGSNIKKNIKLVKGTQINYWYNEESYAKPLVKRASLNDSCMRKEECQDFFTVYIINENISLCILLDEYNELLARAIIWHNIIINGNKSTLMDKIYSIDNGACEEIMKNYARANGWYHKVYQGKGNDDTEVSEKAKMEITNGKEILKNYTAIFYIKPLDDYTPMPYMDTLKYLKEYYDENIGVGLYLTNVESNDWKCKFDQTDGTFTKNTNFKSKYDNIFELSYYLNCDFSDIKIINDDLYSYKNNEYYVSNNLDTLIERIVNKNPDSLFKIYPDVDFNSYIDKDELIFDTDNEFNSEWNKNPLKVFYNVINLKLITKLLKSASKEEVSKALLTTIKTDFLFYKNHIESLFKKGDVIVITKELEKICKIENIDCPNIIGRIYIVKEDFKSTAKSGKPYDMFRIYNNFYKDYETYGIPKEATTKLDKLNIGSKSDESINVIFELLDKSTMSIEYLAHLLLLKYTGKLKKTSKVEVDDRVIIVNGDYKFNIGTVVSVRNGDCEVLFDSSSDFIIGDYIKYVNISDLSICEENDVPLLNNIIKANISDIKFEVGDSFTYLNLNKMNNIINIPKSTLVKYFYYDNLAELLENMNDDKLTKLLQEYAVNKDATVQVSENYTTYIARVK